jgi:hypothetical protein
VPAEPQLCRRNRSQATETAVDAAPALR